MDLHSLASKAVLHSKMVSQVGTLRFADTFRTPRIKTGCGVVFAKVQKNPSGPLWLSKWSWKLERRFNAHVVSVSTEPINKCLCLKLASVQAGGFLVPDLLQEAEGILSDWGVRGHTSYKTDNDCLCILTCQGRMVKFSFGITGEPWSRKLTTKT